MIVEKKPLPYGEWAHDVRLNNLRRWERSALRENLNNDYPFKSCPFSFL